VGEAWLISKGKGKGRKDEEDLETIVGGHDVRRTALEHGHILDHKYVVDFRYEGEGTRLADAVLVIIYRNIVCCMHAGASS